MDEAALAQYAERVWKDANARVPNISRVEMRDKARAELIKYPFRLRDYVMMPLGFWWEAMTDRGLVTIDLSPRELVIRAQGGPLDPWLDRLMPWDRLDDLPAAFIAARYLIPAQGVIDRAGRKPFAERATLYVRPDSPLPTVGRAWYVAARGVFGILTEDGFRQQEFADGLLASAPKIYSDDRYGLLAVFAFSEDTPGLPFTPASIEEAVSDRCRPALELRYHDTDPMITDRYEIQCPPPAWESTAPSRNC